MKIAICKSCGEVLYCKSCGERATPKPKPRPPQPIKPVASTNMTFSEFAVLDEYFEGFNIGRVRKKLDTIRKPEFIRQAVAAGLPKVVKADFETTKEDRLYRRASEKEKVQVFMDEELYERLDAKAKRYEKSTSEMLLQAIMKGISLV
jgi:hypothetical protein